jgi:hypothetical protein
MHSSITMNGLLYASSMVVGSLVAAAPLCNDTIDIAGGGLPNTNMPPSISASAVKDFQVALFLENLGLSFLQAGLANMTKWNTTGYPNDTIEVVTKVVAVSSLAPKSVNAHLIPS